MATLRAGVVGHPIAHSLSPAIHTAALRAAGIDGAYEAFDVTAEAFGAFIARCRSEGVRGLNVTVPHKTAAFESAERRSAEAQATGAVNALVFDDAAVGHNTDVVGVRRALDDLGVDVPGSRALVLGAGGAGRAAAWVLGRGGATVEIANRTRSRAEATEWPVVDWDDVPVALGRADLLVNATSVGLGTDESPVDADMLRAAAAARLKTVLDVVYGPGETELVRLSRAAGLRAADGLSMLVYQAAEAFRLFFGIEAPLGVMFEAARTSGTPSERTS